MENLDDWLTPMQAVAWIALRDPVCVKRASLDAKLSRAAAADLDDRDILDDERPGLTFHTIDLRLHHPQERPDRSAELARDQLIHSLRRAEVTASGEPLSSEQPERVSRRPMTMIDWIGLTLIADQHDDRTLVVQRPIEGRLLFYGRYVETIWQHVLINTEALLSSYPPPERREPDHAPEGYQFIDVAVESIKKQLVMPEGPAVKWLREKLLAAEIQSYKRREPKLIKVPFVAWSDADIDLMEFREAGYNSLRLEGQTFHLHRVVLDVHDFEFCLGLKVRKSAVSEPAAKAQACVPAELAAWMKQHMQDGLDKYGVLPKRNPSVKQCMEALGCSWRAGLAAYLTLPAELRRSARETDRALSVQRALARTAIKTV